MINEPVKARRIQVIKVMIGAVVAIAVISIIAHVSGMWQRPTKDIFDAAWKGDLRAVARYLDNGVDPNCLNDINGIPLHYAKTREVAELLLSKGSMLDAPNAFGGTPLHMAAVNGRTEVAAFLVERGADINAPDVIGGTPLDHALAGREKKTGGGDHDGVIKLLQSKGGVARLDLEAAQ